MKTLNLLLLSLFFISFSACKTDNNTQKNIKNTKDNIIFAVPFAPVSYPLFKMIEDGVFDSENKKTELILWKTPDQLKAIVAGGQADIFAMPSNVAATFYNKNIDVKLLNISIWRAIWLVSRSDDKKTLADFKEEEIAMPFKGNMPHIVFMELARKQGLDPEKDFKLTYVTSPMDAAKRMIMRRSDNALLIDPAVSMVIEKSKSGLASVIAPDIYRSVDIQNEWGRLFNTENEIPFAGMMAVGEITKNKKLLEKFNKEYKKAAEWCMNNPEETAKMVVEYVPQLNEKAVAEAMRNVTLKSIDAKDVKEKLEEFYTILHKSKPALVGGKLPDENFYFDYKKKAIVMELKPTSLPAYMKYVLENAQELNITEEQKKKLLSFKDNFKPKATTLTKSIKELSKTIKLKSLANADKTEIEQLSLEYGKLREALTLVKTNCRDEVASALDKNQWNNLVEIINKTSPYEMGDPLGRMSPIPNYMIEVFHAENLKLTEEQKNKLTGWSKTRHANAVAIHSTIAELEQETRNMSLEKKPKEEILKKVKEMEKLRHKITVTKTVCRNFMKNEVLEKKKWEILNTFVKNKYNLID